MNAGLVLGYYILSNTLVNTKALDDPRLNQVLVRRSFN